MRWLAVTISLLILWVALCGDALAAKSTNGLELLSWWTAEQNGVWVKIRDRTSGYRRGTLDYVLTSENGGVRSGRIKYACGPEDQSDTRLYLTAFRRKDAGQWSTLALTFTDNKGTSVFSVRLYLP